MVTEETQETSAPKKPGPKPKAKQEETTVGTATVRVVPDFSEFHKVTIGRIVCYVTGNGTIRPAIISAVRSDEVVDLTVFNSEGAVAVTHVQHEDIEQEWIETAEDIAGTWHWPL